MCDSSCFSLVLLGAYRCIFGFGDVGYARVVFLFSVVVFCDRRGWFEVKFCSSCFEMFFPKVTLRLESVFESFPIGRF